MNAALDDAERPFGVQLRYDEFESDSPLDRPSVAADIAALVTYRGLT
jgi:hypothetical protein